MTVPRPLMQNNYVFFFQFRKIYVRILCLDAAMSYSMRLFKPCVTSRAIASHVLGDGRRRGLEHPRGSNAHLELGCYGEWMSDGSALDTQCFFDILTCLHL